MRDLDDPIPPNEALYRSLAHDESDADAVLPTSVQLPAISVDRSKYLTRPEDALKEGDTGIAETTPGTLPGPMTSPGGVVHEIRAEDAPAEGDAHAEIRVRRQGHTFNPRYKIESKPFRLELKSAIAASFKVIIPPRPPVAPEG